MEKTREINLTELLWALVRKAWLIVICTVLCGLLAYIYTANFITPLYSSSVTIYVNNIRSSTQTAGISASDLATSQRLVLTYVNILKTDTVLEKVADAADVDLSADQLRSMITAEALDETEVFRVNISHSNPYVARDIANAIADVAPGEITNIVDGSSTKIVDRAKVAVAPYTPDRMQNTLIGALAGMVLAAVFVVLQTLLDVRIKDEEDLAQISKAPVLGMIPDLTTEIKDQYGYTPHGNKRQKKEAGQ